MQAISRDLLAAAMQRVEAAGYKIVIHVHDEIVAEAPDGFGSVEEFTRLITALPEWAEGLPVAAKVRNGPRFSKSERVTSARNSDSNICQVEEQPIAPVIAEENEARSEEMLHEIIDGAEALPWEGESIMGERPPAPQESIDDIVITDMPHIDIRKIMAEGFAFAPKEPKPSASKANGHDHDRGSSGSRAEAARDTYADDHAGEKFDDSFLRRQGYRLAKVYDYKLPDGTILYQQNRYELRDGIEPNRKRPRKKFLPHRGAVLGAGDRLVIYNWPSVVRAGPGSTVFITEGEKNADALIAAGWLATTVLSHKWTPECASALVGFDVIILEDHDKDGRKQADIAHKTLVGGAASIRIVTTEHLWKHLDRQREDYRDIQPKDDVDDWIAAGGDTTKLLDICREIPVDGGELEEWDAGELLSQDRQPPPRQWLYGWQLCRGFASSLVAPGDRGKTTLRLTQAVELAAGHELLGNRIYQRCRVLMMSLEDDQNELWRRLLAIGLHHHVDPAELRGWLFCANFNGAKIAEEIDGKRVLGKLEPMLRRAIERRRPDAVILDPFVKLHALDENSNPDMDFVCSRLVRLAQEYNIAIDSPAHTRKGSLTAGDSNNRRGASAQRDAARLDYTLTTMSEAEAKQFGIEPDMRKSYVRLDRAKANIVRAIKASWYQLVSVQLGNSTDQYPEGDAVQALEKWVPPDIKDVDPDSINRILDRIDAGLPSGDRYSDASAATDRAAWPVVQDELPDISESQAREVIRDLLKKEVLFKDDYSKAGHGKTVKGLFVDNEKRP